jgi:hypothetical protein
MRVGSLLGQLLLTSACASAPLAPGGSLSSYEQMQPARSLRARALIFANAQALAGAHSVRIAPVAFRPGAADVVSPAQAALIARGVGRTLCLKLSQHFDMVAPEAPADLTVRVSVIHITPTDRAAAAVTVPMSAGSMAMGIPMIPRLPVGLGAFSAEGEAVDASGARRAALVWSRGADILTSRPRMSRIGDAYSLSLAFAGDLAGLILTARNPLHDVPPLTPRARRRPTPALCETLYGHGRPVESFIAGYVAAPPEWTEDAGRAAAKAPPKPKPPKR